MICPVIQAACSEQMSAATLPTSSGVPNRPMGVHPRTCQFPCGTSGRNRAPAGAQAKFVQRMRTTARRLADLIVSLLDYAAIESGKLDVRIEPVDPRAL